MKSPTKKELMVRIGNNVRKYRMERKLTQDELAERVGVNVSAITRIEGGTRMMSVPLLYNMAVTLNVGTDSLLQEENNNACVANVRAILLRQSEESLMHLEQIIQVIVKEYGDKDIINVEKETGPTKG